MLRSCSKRVSGRASSDVNRLGQHAQLRADKAMRSVSRLIVAFVLVMTSSLQNARADDSSGCAKSAKEFLRRPDRTSFAGLGPRHGAECWSTIGATNDSLNALLGSVASGNEWSARYLVGNLDKLDGGNLEDAYIALGLLAERHVEVMFHFNQIGLLSRQDLASALTMLPWDLADDEQGQLRRMVLRRSEIARVRERRFEQEKVFSLRVVDDVIAGIKPE